MVVSSINYGNVRGYYLQRVSAHPLTGAKFTHCTSEKAFNEWRNSVLIKFGNIEISEVKESKKANWKIILKTN